MLVSSSCVLRKGHLCPRRTKRPRGPSTSGLQRPPVPISPSAKGRPVLPARPSGWKEVSPEELVSTTWPRQLVEPQLSAPAPAPESWGLQAQTARGKTSTVAGTGAAYRAATLTVGRQEEGVRLDSSLQCREPRLPPVSPTASCPVGTAHPAVLCHVSSVALAP